MLKKLPLKKKSNVNDKKTSFKNKIKAENQSNKSYSTKFTTFKSHDTIIVGFLAVPQGFAYRVNKCI